METSRKKQKVEISAPGNCTLGAAVWDLLDRGFVVTITPSKNGVRAGGYSPPPSAW